MQDTVTLKLMHEQTMSVDLATLCKYNRLARNLVEDTGTRFMDVSHSVERSDVPFLLDPANSVWKDAATNLRMLYVADYMDNNTLLQYAATAFATFEGYNCSQKPYHATPLDIQEGIHGPTGKRNTQEKWDGRYQFREFIDICIPLAPWLEEYMKLPHTLKWEVRMASACVPYDDEDHRRWRRWIEIHDDEEWFFKTSWQDKEALLFAKLKSCTLTPMTWVTCTSCDMYIVDSNDKRDGVIFRQVSEYLIRAQYGTSLFTNGLQKGYNDHLIREFAIAALGPEREE